MCTDNDPTQLIRTTLTLDIAAMAMIMTPNAQWYVPIEKLVRQPGLFMQLRKAVQEWDTAMFLVEQFERRSAARSMSIIENEAWDEALNTLTGKCARATELQQDLMK